MANVQKSRGKAEADPHAADRLKSYYHSASLKMSPEPYAESHRAIFSIARIYPMFYHPSSILLGFGSIWFFLSFSNIGDVASYTWAEWLMVGLITFMLVLVMVGLEVGKSALSSVVFKVAALQWKQTRWHIVCLTLFMLISIGVSSIGGAYLTIKWSDKSSIIDKKQLVQLDSVQQLYDKEIAQIDSTRRLYFEQNSWLGKLDHTARKQYNAYEEEALTLKKEKRAAMERLRTMHFKESQDVKNANMQFGFIAAIFILVLEILSLIAYRYRWIYLSTVYHEGIRLDYIDEPENNSFSKNDLLVTSLTRLLEHLDGNPPRRIAHTESETEKLQIGFQFGLQSVDEEAKRRANYLKKWDFVVKDLESGLAISDILKRHKGRVSRSTVKNIKRCLEN